MMNEYAYANDFKEIRNLKFALDNKGKHVILINPSLSTSCLFGLTMKEIKYKNS